jgi:hypothetical protein
MHQRRVTFLLTYLLLATAIAMQMGRANWLAYYRLTKGTPATATVTQTACADHGTFAYRFEAGGQSFGGSGDGGYGNPPCAELKTGDRVSIYYLAADPRINGAGDPRGRLFDATLAIATAALFVPLVIIFLLFVLSRWRLAHRYSSLRP